MQRWWGLVFSLAVLTVAVTKGCDSSPRVYSDPGGPFHTDVSATHSISLLDPAESGQLCSDLIAFGLVSTSALDTESVCRSVAIEVAPAVTGGDFQTNCQEIYAECKAMGSYTPVCPLPLPDCHATVGDLRACIDEIAAATPLESCLTIPSCEQIVPGQPIPYRTEPATSSLPPTPACERVRTKGCKALAPWTKYLCGK
ncbi:MAG TPA: hypothetical protein VHU40_17995 [Polyangia bacterium]|jgi:hypothetical protein|nr:hypothetical protein [Polyangia bacterium]